MSKNNRNRDARSIRLQRQADKLLGVVEHREERAKRTPQEQLKQLDFRLGKGIGTAKERKRLKEQIASKKPP